jgi:lipopolysaccharide export system permease protein
MPGRLNAYIGRRFMAAIAMMLGGVALVVFVANYVELLRRFSDEDAFTPFLGVELALMSVPIILDSLLPFAFLFAAMLCLLDLSRKMELAVARASGVSVWGFLRAPFVIALLFGAAATAAFNPVAVALKGRAENIEAQMSGARAHQDSERWFRQRGKDGPSIVHAGSTSADGTTVFGVTAYVFDRAGAFLEKVTAPRADYDARRWVFSDAQIVSRSEAPRRADAFELPTDLTEAELKRSVSQPSQASIWQLPGAIAVAKQTGLNTDRFRLAFHVLLDRPLFLLAMVTVAATVSLRLTRYGGTWRLILIGTATGFLLYVLTAIVNNLGENGIIPPIIAAWLSPIVALSLGATVLLYQEDG